MGVQGHIVSDGGGQLSLLIGREVRKTRPSGLLTATSSSCKSPGLRRLPASCRASGYRDGPQSEETAVNGFHPFRLLY